MQILVAGKAEKELLWKVWGSVNLIFPTFKNQIILLSPKPIHPPRHCLVHHCSHEPTWKTWRCQSLDGVINPQCQEKQLSGSTGHLCPQPGQVAALLPRVSAGSTPLAAATANKGLSVHLLSPQTNRQEVKKPWKGRELLSHFEFL